jgi:hypothetical protein
MARMLLAIAVVAAVIPASNGPQQIVLAEDGSAQTVSRAIADDDLNPEHAAPRDGEPFAAPQGPISPFAPPADEPGVRGAAPALVDATSDDGLPIRTAEVPEDEPLPAADGPFLPATGNGRVPPTSPSQTAASSSCPAELGRANSAVFGRDDRLVMTYYYYWYDEASLKDPALSQHPPPEPALDWRSVSWHERQLADMASAGIDVALAVYWGDTDTWSLDGLDAMVKARENLLSAGLRAPAIGLFFDTNMYAMILPERPELNDLTTDDGLDMMADQIGAFLDRVPPCHRARVDGRPLAFFWRADTEDGDRFKFDDNTFDNITDMIAARYDERLHITVEKSWQEAAERANVELGAVDVYRWGAALNGPRFEGRTVAVGPGYDDTRIDGRPGYTRERVDGGTYSRDLRQAVMSGTSWLLLETWNELWEGTAIAETEETGRTYLGITARYTALFHQLARERARDGWFDLGTGYNSYLRRLADASVEQGDPYEVEGRRGARPLREDDDGTGYFHFALDRRLGLDGAQPLTVDVEYFDEGDGSFALEYDSLERELPSQSRAAIVLDGSGADSAEELPLADEATVLGREPAEAAIYRRTEPVFFENTRTWRTHRFELADASMRHRQYDGAGDFRIHDIPGSDNRLHAFGRVTATAVPAARPVAYEPENLTFVDPGPRSSVTLRWGEAMTAAGYLVVVQPFDVDDETDLHGFTIDDRQHCLAGPGGEAAHEDGRFGGRASCELLLTRELADGVYRWRVQALDVSGIGQGQTSDWGYFVIARR